MTLNAVIALILRFLTEFHRLSGQLYHNGWRTLGRHMHIVAIYAKAYVHIRCTTVFLNIVHCINSSVSFIAQPLVSRHQYYPLTVRYRCARCDLFRYVTNQPTKASSAFHPFGVGKWLPASARKAKADMVHYVSGWTRGVQVKLWALESACHTWAP